MTVNWKGNEAKDIVLKAMHEAIWEMGEKILSESKNLAPKDTGTLRRSSTTSWGNKPSLKGTYNVAKSGGTPKKAQMSDNPKAKYLYITYNTPYALYMHEGRVRHGKGTNATYSGNLHYTNGGAKFLEKAYKRYVTLIPRFVDMRVKQALAKGGKA